MVTATAYLYPWDVVGDPAAAERVAALGVDSVALAAAYHSVRAATPFHPRHRMVDAYHAALYLPVREKVWAGARLVPGTPGWMTRDDSFTAARDALRAVGLPVHAWTVLTHNTRLGRAHPELSVHNAFGDRYPYALCPASAQVREYCATLVGEILDQGRPDGLVLEACGPLGLGHGGHHEKTDGADWDAARDRLLSLCFCVACLGRYRDAGLDADRLRDQVRAAVDGGASAAVDAQTMAAVAGVRTRLAADLRRAVLDARASRPTVTVALHASADPWATGPFATLVAGTGPDPELDVLVASAWTGARQGVANLAALRDLAGPAARLGAYLPVLPPRPGDARALADEWAACLDAGADELHLYHAGLASRARLTAAGEALSAVRAAPRDPARAAAESRMPSPSSST
ncbi:hypothetical protein OG568_43885 [Streptomyces sp. NBC_01450]|uniref:hypothetical protein n=1 Tax=Streptomyces sp. NBC_01450 TaxID=2903871 RepID=UPI002E3122B0|nr:hypothetical protein [Streptomyces sp. NBC_01450]